MEFNTDIFKQFDKKWALLTAGKEDNFNTMTISWGGLGTLWNKPVATVYVRESRLTHEYMDKEEYFTVSFYPESLKEILSVMGSKSGRDIDKMNYEGLTKVKAGESVSFKEAEVTLVCKKLYMGALDVSKMPEDVQKSAYAAGDPHDMYIGEVVDIIRA
ncbi:MAG: flavin reductase [Lachnospiraceae bacterium]|nr:flavin reductase [Lachnospiraceae bacterium]